MDSLALVVVMHCFVVVLKSNLVMYDDTLNSDLVHLVAVDRACKRSYFDMESSVVDTKQKKKKKIVKILNRREIIRYDDNVRTEIQRIDRPDLRAVMIVHSKNLNSSDLYYSN